MSDLPQDLAEDEGDWAALVPELLVSDLEASQAFYCGLCGFAVKFARPEEGFVYLTLGRAQIMLEAIGPEAWVTGSLERPFGRGMNLQIEVADLGQVLARLEAAGVPLFRPLRREWYREGTVEHGQAEFLVQDPDGYLLRFVEVLGTRAVGAALP
jgi:catechol 2,3-dioxygenase-like lactoylglutathione lyase family enzyme